MATPAKKPASRAKTTAAQKSKQQSMLAESARSTDSRKRSKNAATADKRIKGHALGVNKANKGKQSAKENAR